MDEFGLAEVLFSHLCQFKDQTGIEVAILIDPEFPRLPAATENALFRIAQEALTNVMMHAAATKVSVTLTKSGAWVRLIVHDNGRSWVAPKAEASSPAGSGWGLTIMRERAALIGATFRVATKQDKGTSITVEIGQR